MSKRNRRNQKPVYFPQPKVDNTILDIVIPVYNRFDLLEKCLDCIPKSANSVTYHIICVDNGSVIMDADEFYASRKDIIVIRNQSNLGFPMACNIGVNKKRAPLIFLLNSDVLLEPNSIELLVKEMDNPTTGVAGMLLVFPEFADDLNPSVRPANKVQHIGLETNIHGKWVHQFIGWSEDNPRVQKQRDVYAVTGAALMTRRTIWNKVGGLYEGYGLGSYEDADYAMSVRELGYNIVVVPKAKGIHYTGATAEKYNLAYPMDKNRMIFMQRWQDKLVWTDGLKY